MVKNFEDIYRACLANEIGIEKKNELVILENGDEIKISFQSTRHVGGVGFRSEIRTIDKNPRQGTIRSYDDCAIIELP